MKRGFSMIEVILAAALFVIFASAIVKGLIGGLDSNRLAAEQVVAKAYAEEGLEAIRSMRNQLYSTLADTSPTTGIARTTNVWAYSGVNNIFDSRYTRTITVSSVNRDGSGNIVPAPTGTLDANTKKVQSKVNWNFTTARPQEVALSTYITNWRAAIAASGPMPMMVYSKTTTTPFYRIWDGTTWGAEGSAQVVGGNINYVVLKVSRTRNEVVLGTLDSNGNIYAQVWNGTSWGTPTLMANVTAANSTTRSFDMDYEKSGDRLVFTYLPTSTSADFAYRIWDGTAWSSATTITTPPTTGVIKSIDVTANPLSASNEIAMVMVDANIDVYGMVWTGSAWSNMSDAAVWDATASFATKKIADVAYEQASGRAMFIWGDSVATDQYFRIWNGSTLTAATLLDIPAAGGVVHWVELVSRPASNELMYATVDAGSDLNTRKWSGSAWDTATQHAEHSAGVENITSMAFDAVWESHSSSLGEAWLVWGDGATVTKKQWTGAAWAAGSVLTGSDDTSFIRLKAEPTTGEVFAGIYESAASATDDIWESRLSGGGTTWTAKNTLWGGPTTAEPVHFRIDIATR